MKNLDIIKKSDRQSNIELLRIISMFFVLVVHSNYMGVSILYNSPYTIETFIRFLAEAIAIIGVNCFVLISGYFGIHLNIRKILHFIFIVYFYSLIRVC